MIAGPQDQTVILSGASGLLGAALRRELEQRGTPVLQLVRSGPLGPSRILWNPGAIPAIEQDGLLDGCSAAIHLSGANVAAHRWTPDYRREITVSRIASTQALARELAVLRHPPHTLLVASATGIYGNRAGEILDEISIPGTGFLADLTYEWEKAAMPARQAGIRVVHLRFGVVLGLGGGALARMLPIFRAGLGGKLGSGRQWMSWVSLTDAVAAVLFALDNSSVDGPINITAPNPVTNAEFTRVLAHHLRRPAILPAPAFALRLAFGSMADEALLASTRAMPSRLLTAGFHFRHPTLADALHAILV